MLFFYKCFVFTFAFCNFDTDFGKLPLNENRTKS